MTTPHDDPAPEPRLLGRPWPILDAAAYLTISPRHLHRLLEAGKVRSVRLGRRRLIPDDEVRRLAREGC